MSANRSSEESLVVLLDILGFKKMIEEGEEDNILSILTFFSGSNQASLYESLGNIRPEISSFSDHIVISLSLNQFNKLSKESSPLLQRITPIINKFYIFALTRGVALRGVMHIGNLYHNYNIIFGEALIKCDYLEKNIAHFPKIILSDEALYFFKSKEINFESFISTHTLKKDKQTYYLDGLKSTVINFSDAIVIKSNIENCLKKLHNNCRALKKWRWLATSFNEAVDYWKSVLPLDEQFQSLEKIYY